MTELNDHSSRSHALLSASSSHRWLACPPSAVAAEAYEDTGSDYAAEGTLAHEIAELYARELSLNGKGSSTPDELDRTVSEDMRAVYGAEMLECARGWHDYIQEHIKGDDACVLLEQRVDFSAWVPDGFGTCDCILIQGNTLTIMDYKYGQGVPVDAKENSQMMLYALGALEAFGVAYDIEDVEMHIYQPRINNISVWGSKADGLLYWAEHTVKRIAAQAAQGKGKYRAGVHCKFCPHAGRCRQLTKTCTEFVETHGQKVAVPVLAPHEVAEVLAMQPTVDLWLKRVRDQALTTMLDGGTIPGYKVVEGRGSRSWTDEETVVNTLEGASYPPNVFTKTELLSPAALEKAIGKKATGELLADLIVKRRGAPNIAPASDKREPYDGTADFENLEE